MLLHVGVSDIVRVAVYRGGGSSRGYRVSFVVSIGVIGEGVVEVCLRGRGGIAVVVVRVGVGVGVVEAVVGVGVGVLESVDVEILLGIVIVIVIQGEVVVLGVNVKDGRGRAA